MSLRLIAKDLYRLRLVVERLEQELAAAPVAKRDPLMRKLSQARNEYEQVRDMLDGRLDRRTARQSGSKPPVR